MTTHYLGLKQMAERLHVVPSTLSHMNLPEPDAMIGRTRGWTVKTIDEWNASRPGRGNWKHKS